MGLGTCVPVLDPSTCSIPGLASLWASRLLSMIGDLSLLPPTFTDLSKDPTRWHMPALCHSSNITLTTFSRLQKHALKQLFSGHPSSVWQLPLYPTAAARAPAFLNSTQRSPEITMYTAKAYNLQAAQGRLDATPRSRKAPGPTGILSRLRPPGAPENKLRSFLQFGEGTPSSDRHNPLPQAKSRSSRSRLP